MKFTHTLAIASAITALLAACGNAQPVNPTPVPDLPTPAPPTFEVQRGLVARGVEFNARVQPASSETLAFQTDGRLYKLNVKEGDKVKAGDILAELDLTDLKAQLEQETIRLRTAQSVLSNTVQTFSETVRLAQLDLDQAKLRYEVALTRAGGDNSVLNNDLKRIDKRIAEIENSIKQARANFDQAGADNAAKVLEDALIERERVLANLSDADRGLRAHAKRHHHRFHRCRTRLRARHLHAVRLRHARRRDWLRRIRPRRPHRRHAAKRSILSLLSLSQGVRRCSVGVRRVIG